MCLLINLQVSAMVGSVYILALAIIACAYGQHNSIDTIRNKLFGAKTVGYSHNEQPIKLNILIHFFL